MRVCLVLPNISEGTPDGKSARSNVRAEGLALLREIAGAPGLVSNYANLSAAGKTNARMLVKVLLDAEAGRLVDVLLSCDQVEIRGIGVDIILRETGRRHRRCR